MRGTPDNKRSSTRLKRRVRLHLPKANMYVHALSLTCVNRHLSSRETLGTRRDTRGEPRGANKPRRSRGGPRCIVHQQGALLRPERSHDSKGNQLAAPLSHSFHTGTSERGPFSRLPLGLRHAQATARSLQQGSFCR